MPNPREVYKQKMAEQAEQASAASDVRKSSETEVAASATSPDLRESSAGEATPNPSAPTTSAPNTSVPAESLPDTSAPIAAPTAAPTNSAKTTFASDTSTTSQTPEASSGQSKAKPSPRRGKVDTKDDAKIIAVRRESRKRLIRRLVIVLLIAFAIAAVAGFIFLRWGAQDDTAMLVGKWQISGSDSTIEITESKIVLNDEVSYDYTIDPISKTLQYTFNTLEGHGRYRFSLDGNHISISDGDFDFMSTLLQDVPWMTGALVNPDANPPILDDDSMQLDRVE